MHGCVAIHYLKRDLVEFVDKFFSVENFIITHEGFNLLPINGQDMWLEASGAQVLLPPFRVQSGAKKLRRREVDEVVNILETQTTKLRQFDVQMTCKLCKEAGHNIRSYKAKKKFELYTAS